MSVQKFLDEVGLGHTWSKIKTLLNGKADTDLNNVTNDNFRDKAIDAGVGGLQVVTATSTDGVTYTATVAGVTALTAGLTIVIIPDVVSTSISAKLNVNGLGDKYIRQSTTNNSTTGLTPKNAGWMAANKPITIQYDGTQWKTIAARSNASDLNGTVAIANGGTGATSAEDARTNLGLGALATLDTAPVANGGTGATTAANARTNLGLSTAFTAASISGRNITLTKADGTTQTLTTQDTDNNTVPSRYITSKWTSGTSWYEVYNDGWVRQGGYFTFTSAENTITMHRAMANTNYNVQVTQRVNHDSSWTNNVWVKNISSASAFIVRGETSKSNSFYWQVEGQGA